MLNTGQQSAYDAVFQGKSIFITGPGGTGKSYLLNSLLKITDRKVSLTALTGCAALLLHPKAKTIHSWAGIGLGKDPTPMIVAAIRKSRRTHMRWLSTDILVIDEVSMMTPELFEKIDEVGRKVRRNDTPFGGLQIILVGDFYQLPPVAKGDTMFVFESPLWKTLGLTTHELTEIVRQKDPEFQKILNLARRGELTKPDLRFLARRMGLDYKSQIIQPTMLFTRRAEVDAINMKHLRQLTTERRTFRANLAFIPIANTEHYTDKDPFVQGEISKKDRDAPYTSELILAVGAQVMLITNLEPEAGLVNGSRGVVVGYEAPDEKEICDTALEVPVVQFRNGDRRKISHASWEVLPGVMRRQIPLKLAYAITIHKSQGATLDCALIDIGGRTFEYGQAYVALSRVRDMDSLYIHDLSADAFRAHPKVKEFYNRS